MQAIDRRDSARATARLYESTLPAEQRKALGQFFTGLPLGKLLAHLSLDSGTKTVLDPMAGHGDLLDAVWEAAADQAIVIERLDGIEIDEGTASVCRERLSTIVGTYSNPPQHIWAGSAFDIDVISQLPRGGYDLVITNPPYVRYQTRQGRGLGNQKIRDGLQAFVNDYIPCLEKDIWRRLIKGYSGLADLSVPAWMLASLLVRPGGRLAMVVPATWRSRDYAEVIRYIMLRCFVVEYIVEDTQPGWFGEALIRTHLVVARRLPLDEVTKPLSNKVDFPSAEWVQLASEAANKESLVGEVFDGKSPEADFVSWLRNKSEKPHPSIRRHNFDSRQEWELLESSSGSKNWYIQLEGLESRLRLFPPGAFPSRPPLPDAVRDIVPQCIQGLFTLEDAGIHIGQGLRTGCNQFFYVTSCSTVEDGLICVRASPTLENQEFAVPEGALRPVLRRQSEVPVLRTGQKPPGRVLDLRDWVLPEDAETVTTYLSAYRANGQAVPVTMPIELAKLVRLAAVSQTSGVASAKPIPDLSAVRTNVRIPRNGSSTPRFWYMLPDFTPRHFPSVFIARINHNRPWAEANLDPPILVDANFSSFTSATDKWTRFGLKAMLNSVWCRTLMEALGTPLGGGALKLEASHLRRMPIPRLPNEEISKLNLIGRELTQTSSMLQETVDGIILRGVLGAQVEVHEVSELSDSMEARANKLHFERQRVLL